MRRPAALAVALLWLATPAAAFPEGSFAAPERDARVLVERTDDGGLRVELEAPDFGAPLRADLVPRADGTIFEEPLAPRGFLDRLVSRRAERLPFEGRRLVWAARMEESLVVTTLEVDHGGHPDLRRAELSITEADELRLALWRYAGMTAAPGPRLVLQRVER